MLIQSIKELKTIIDNPKLKEAFYFKTANRKYPIKQLLTHILFILKSGISYRMFNDFIENKYKTPSMLNGVAETQLFLNKISVKQLSPNIKYMMNNLRMSICELG